MITALICARGGSKSLPDKNIKLLNGRPLIEYAISTAKECYEIDNIIISTDDKRIENIAKKLGAEVPFLRPKELASDIAPEWLVWQHALRFLHSRGNYPEQLVVLPPTAPLRRVEDVAMAIKMQKEKKIDGIISITNSQRNPCFNMVKINSAGLVEIALQTEEPIHRRQDAPEFFDITTAFYVMDPIYVLSSSKLFEGNIGFVNIPQETAIDIDNELDFDMAEFLLNRRKG